MNKPEALPSCVPNDDGYRKNNVRIAVAILLAGALTACGGERKNDPLILTDDTLNTALTRIVDETVIPNTEAYWVVDPLDGTTNFAAGIPYWSISVARFVDGKPQSSFLIIPTLKKKFVSIKGKGVWLNNKKIDPSQNNRQSECISLCSRSIKILQKKPNSVFPGKIRLLGVSSLNLTSVAMGQTFGAIESTPKIWDIAAAWLLLEELNCSIEWLETDPLNLVSGEDLSDVNFPLIACRSIEKVEILKPWGNLLLEK